MECHLDTECLKMDLHDERIREKSLAEQKRQQKSKLIEILSEETTHDEMSDIEKCEFADKYNNRLIIICLGISIADCQNNELHKYFFLFHSDTESKATNLLSALSINQQFLNIQKV